VVERAVEHEFRGARHRLVEELRSKGIRDLAVLRAVEMTPRHLFVPSGIRHRAYEDAPLPIGNGQTISQPLIHAQYLELLELKGPERVLEIGTGTGYQTALLSHLVDQVFSIERIAALNKQARAILEQLGLRNVSLMVGDGTHGWKEHAPFDAILVSAGSPSVPQPLLDQLADDGRLLVPVGDREIQELMMYKRRGIRIEKRKVAPVRFVPLIGAHGWEEDGGAESKSP
jgi:protein-L-isoaspartate(D-aspartate) O-methyltransferase